MGMVLNETGTHELMINVKTGVRFLRELTTEELRHRKAHDIIADTSFSAEEKFELLTDLGCELHEIVEMALQHD